MASDPSGFALTSYIDSIFVGQVFGVLQSQLHHNNITVFFFSVLVYFTLKMTCSHGWQYEVPVEKFSPAMSKI